MNNIKMIALFHPYEKTPFLICIENQAINKRYIIKSYIFFQ